MTAIRRIGFVGLGIMGGPMACNLVRKGFEVTVYNRSREKTAEAAKLGAKVAGSVAEAVSGRDAVVLVLAHDKAVEEVVLGPGGVLESAAEGTLVLDSSTIHPNTSRKMAEKLGERGIGYMDTPVTGSRPQSEGAKLVFLVGGSAEQVARATPLFEAMGRKHVHFGPTGSAACAKLCNNMMALINLAGFCESMAIGKKFGLDPKQVYAMISESGGRSWMSELKGPKVLSGEYSPDFALELAAKDVALGRALSEDLSQYAPMIAAAAKVFGEATPSGPGEDMASLYRWYVAGREGGK